MLLKVLNPLLEYQPKGIATTVCDDSEAQFVNNAASLYMTWLKCEVLWREGELILTSPSVSRSATRCDPCMLYQTTSCLIPSQSQSVRGGYVEMVHEEVKACWWDWGSGWLYVLGKRGGSGGDHNIWGVMSAKRLMCKSRCSPL